VETERGSFVGSIEVNGASSSPLRGGARASALSLLALAAIVAGAGGGCASTATYRVPGLEVQRLARLPPEARGTDVRVVPETAPLYPSTQRLEPPPPPVVAPPPGPPMYGPAPEVVVVEEQPPVVVEPGVFVDVTVPIGGGHPHVARPPRVIEGRPPPRVAPPPARAGFTGTPVSGGGGLRGSPPVTSAPRTTGWRASPIASAPRSSAPGHTSVPSRSFGGSHSSGGGHHSSGGGGGSNAAAAVGAAVVIVGLVALAAVAADSAAKADQARKLDGWVNVDPGHPLRLHYSNNLERVVPLSDLQPSDTIGLQYGVLSADEGEVQVKPHAAAPVAARTPPAPTPVAPAAATMPTPAPPAAPAAAPSSPAPTYTPAPPPPVPPAPPVAPTQPTS
jgi:hypothetical protein